jgi:hypothetical protein
VNEGRVLTAPLENSEDRIELLLAETVQLGIVINPRSRTAFTTLSGDFTQQAALMSIPSLNKSSRWSSAS